MILLMYDFFVLENLSDVMENSRFFRWESVNF